MKLISLLAFATVCLGSDWRAIHEPEIRTALFFLNEAQLRSVLATTLSIDRVNHRDIDQGDKEHWLEVFASIANRDVAPLSLAMYTFLSSGCRSYIEWKTVATQVYAAVHEAEAWCEAFPKRKMEGIMFPTLLDNLFKLLPEELKTRLALDRMSVSAPWIPQELSDIQDPLGYLLMYARNTALSSFYQAGRRFYYLTEQAVKDVEQLAKQIFRVMSKQLVAQDAHSALEAQIFEADRMVTEYLAEPEANRVSDKWQRAFKEILESILTLLPDQGEIPSDRLTTDPLSLVKIHDYLEGSFLNDVVCLVLRTTGRKMEKWGSDGIAGQDLSLKLRARSATAALARALHDFLISEASETSRKEFVVMELLALVEKDWHEPPSPTCETGAVLALSRTVEALIENPEWKRYLATERFVIKRILAMQFGDISE